MNSQLIIDIQDYRSRKRVETIGEVFTPEHRIHQMLDLFESNIWVDENTIFFEPACGHGNIVVAILDRRIRSLETKYRKSGVKRPLLHALANAINTLWAIDICPKNIEITRKRVMEVAVQALQMSDFDIDQKENLEFLGHMLCTLLWQIHENETLSALSNDAAALARTKMTKIGGTWLKRNGHKPIEFELGWCEFYGQSTKRNAIPHSFKRALQYVESSMSASQNTRRFAEFAFAEDSLASLMAERDQYPPVAGAA